MGELVTVCPCDEVRFKCNASRASFTITNASRCPVAFKIKTTCPERFQVRPSTDVIQCGCSTTVQVTLCQGVCPQDIAGDKFLIVATPVRGSICSRDQLRRLWRCVRRDQRYEHQLCCTVEGPPDTCSPAASTLQCITEKLECLSERLCCRERLADRSVRIQEQNRRLITLSFYLIAALALANGVFLLLAYRAFSSCAGGLVVGLVRRNVPTCCTALFGWLI